MTATLCPCIEYNGRSNAAEADWKNFTDGTMDVVWVIVAIAIVALLIWVRLGWKVRRSAILERSGVSYFKVLLRQRGADLSQFPDAALSSIIRTKTLAAKKQAAMAGLTKSSRAARNWRIILVRSIEAEANMMGSHSKREKLSQPISGTAGDPQKPSVSDPGKSHEISGMTAEQFLEATQRGTLYSELHERQSRRQPS